MTRAPFRLAVTAACLAALPSCRSTQPAADAPTQPAYECQHVTGTITIDGRLDEPDWARAERVSRFYPYTPTTDPERSPTAVRLLWGDGFLYAAFECTDDDIWSFSDEHDDTLWNGDVVELFFQTDTTSRRYIEFVVAPNGTLFDAHHRSRGGGGYHRFKHWESDAKVATTIDGTDTDPSDTDRSYTVELAIPLSALGDVDAAPWRFGVFRFNYSQTFEEPQMLMSIPESLKWGFHYYPGYRPLTFAPGR